MAEDPHSLELLLQCQVCFEEFEKEGEHVPRILPCSHTLCHTCIGRLIRRNAIQCPECREKHEAKNEEQSFPQNKYLLTQIKRKSTQEQPKAYEFRKCEEHGKELNLFCLDPVCKEPICRTCLRTKHKRHDVIEIEEQQKDVLIGKVVTIQMNLETKVKMLSEVKRNIDEKTNMVIGEIKKKKEEINREFDKMIKKG